VGIRVSRIPTEIKVNRPLQRNKILLSWVPFWFTKSVSSVAAQKSLFEGRK
jgi:hypothetical protein